jgi:hypothetical protein
MEPQEEEEAAQEDPTEESTNPEVDLPEESKSEVDLIINESVSY